MVIFHSYVKLPDGISNLPIHVSPAMSIHVVSYHAVEFGTQISPPHFPALPMAAVLFRLGDVTVTIDDLVGGIPTPLKNMTSSVGMMTFPIYGKS